MAAEGGPAREPTEVSTTMDRSVVSRLRAAFEEHGDRIAVDVDGRGISYRQLADASGRLAGAIVDTADEGDAPVVLLCSTGSDLVSGMLAAVRAGRPYIALNEDDPVQRVRFVVDDSHAVLIVADRDARHAAETAADTGVPVIDIGGRKAVGGPPVWIEAPGERALRITYTSGTTGTPKGVVRTRAETARRLDRDEHSLVPGRRLGLLTSATTGMGPGKVMRPLLAGATLCLFDVRTRGVDDLARWLKDARIESVFIVPTVLRRLLAALADEDLFGDLDTVITGGEALHWRDVRRLRRHLPPEARIVNTYGMSEAGRVARYEVPQPAPGAVGVVPVGYAAEGRQVSILGPDGQEASDGETGRIVVRGRHLASGYWGRDELTASAFRRGPDSRTREFVSGDLGRKRADGCLEIVGRVDGVVQISGHSVAPSEVEQAVDTLAEVSAAAVVAVRGRDGEDRLAACVILGPGESVEPAIWRRELAHTLPTHMLPSHFVTVDELPILPSGKVDRGAVRATAQRASAESSRDVRTDPRDDLERHLLRIWRGALDLDGIGVDDDFFEVGGTSLLAASILARVQRDLGHDLDLSLLIEAPTVASMADAIRVGRRSGNAPIVVTLSDGPGVPLFCIHPAGGTVLVFRPLAEALMDRPVYGVRSPARDGRRFDAHSVERIAARYVREVRRIQPVGPYHVLGHSVGGVIAFEMARQLTDAGETVAFVGIGDVSPPRRHGRVRLPSRQRLDRVLRISRTRRDGGGPLLVARRAVGQAWWRTRNWARGLRAERHARRVGAVPPELREAWAWRTHTRASRAYTPRPFEGSVTLFRSRRSIEDPTCGWLPFAEGGVDVVRLEGWHDQIWSEDHVDVNAPRVRDALARAEHGA